MTDHEDSSSDSKPGPRAADSANTDELFEEAHGEALLDDLIGTEMGEEMAATMGRVRRAQEAAYRREHPEERLRERKRRLTRQTISDAATTLFATRGFDNVTVSEVAERVGVSEKTIYNYFPTKESLVLDTIDESISGMSDALRERGPDESLTQAVLRAVTADMRRFDELADELLRFVPMFDAMIETTAPLRAAVLESYDRLTEVIRSELAAQASVDPRDPEVAIAARSLVGLVEVSFASRVRRIQEGLRGEDLRRAVESDIQRAARLLETGLWSFEVLARSARAANQAKEVAQAAEQARVQVVAALRQARASWAEVRRAQTASAKELRKQAAVLRRDQQRARRRRH